MRTPVALLLLGMAFSVTAEDLPIFDAHLHYSHDAWESVPTADAIAILRKAGLKRALISSSGDEGTQQMMLAHARKSIAARHYTGAIDYSKLSLILRRVRAETLSEMFGLPQRVAA